MEKGSDTLSEWSNNCRKVLRVRIGKGERISKWIHKKEKETRENRRRLESGM